MLMSCADFTLSDNLFQVFVIASILLHDQESLGGGSRWIWCGAVMVSLGFLTRASGASLLVAGVLSAFVARSRRDAIVYAGIVAGLTVPWIVWRFAAPEVTNPLLAYYTGYETPALALVRFHPREAWQIVAGNTRYLLESFDVSFLLDAVPAARWLVYPLVLLGSYVMIRRRPIFLGLFVAVYTGAVLNHPFAPGRYVMPLLPIVLLALFTGVFEARTRLAGSPFRHYSDGLPDRGLIVGFAGVPIVLLMAMNLVWFRSYNRPSTDDRVRGFGVRFTVRMDRIHRDLRLGAEPYFRRRGAGDGVRSRCTSSTPEEKAFVPGSTIPRPTSIRSGVPGRISAIQPGFWRR